MKSPKPYLLKAIAFLLVALRFVNSATICKSGCLQSHTDILKLQPGNVYEYSFDSILTVGFGTGRAKDADETSLKLFGNAKVFAEGDCGYTLQLNSVKVSTTKDVLEKKLIPNIQKPVHFTLVNGKLDSEICVDSSDSQYSLNIKRALISLLQCSTEDGSETDAFGQCATHTSVSKTSGGQVVTKVRDLNECSYRENTRSGFIHGIVNSAAGIKTAQLFKASYTKESKISNGIIEHVHLVEDYTFDVIGKGLHSARGKVITNLKVKNPAGIPGTAPPTGTHFSSVIFQKPEMYRTKNFSALKISLTQLVDLLSGYVKKDSAKNFAELIRLMRNADTDTLLELAAVPHENSELARKVYMDALFRTGTSESAKAILKQLNKMDEKEKLIAIISLNLVEFVDKDTINQATALLVPSASNQIYISIGTLVSKYCKVNGCELGDLDVISKKFVDNLKHCKASTKKDEDRIVHVLKGIANMETLSSGSASALSQCASSGRTNRIRVAALQAFSSGRCEPVLIEKSLALLRDRNEDSEIRIEAYLASINCPTSDLATKIAEIVNTEPVHQVGGFIASNLQAIRDSTDDYRAYQRYYLGNIRVTKRFPVNPKRYSFSNEVSYKWDALGVSASSDYNLIYSQHGFLPRSAKLNVSAELFGTNFNVFEVKARQENLENCLEYYLGPKGLLNKNFDEIMKMIEFGGVPSTGRRIHRSISDDTAKFSKKYKTYGSKSIQDVNLDFSVKFFGSEMFFLSLGDQVPSSLDDIFKYFSTAFDNLKKELSSFNKEFILHDLFLDLNVIYPTGLGIPFELNTQGFVANKLDFGINLDVDAIIEENWWTPKYQMRFIPSVDITVKLQLGFNAYVLSTGLQLETNLYSTSGGDVKLNFTNEGNGFNLLIESPRSKLELFESTIQPSFYIAEPDKTVKLQFQSEKLISKDTGNYHTCFNQLNSIGFNLCIDAARISIDREDLAKGHIFNTGTLNVYVEVERQYNLRGSYLPKTNSGSQEWKLEFNTSGSKEDRTTSVSFELGSDPRIYGRLAINSPIYQFAIESGLSRDDKELVLYGQYEKKDEVQRHRIGFLRNGNEYHPIIEIHDKNGISNEIMGYRMNGRVVLQKNEKLAKYNFDNFQITNKESFRLVINGWMEVGPTSLNNELHMTIGSNSYLVLGNLKMDNGIYYIRLFINNENLPESIYGGSAEVQLNEEMIIMHLVGMADTWEVDFNNKVLYSINESTRELSSSNFQNDISITKKKKKIGHLKFNALTTGRDKFEINTELEHGKRAAAFSGKYNRNRRAQGDYVFETRGKYNKYFVDIIAKSDFNGNRFVIDNTFTTSWGTMITAKGEVGQSYTLQGIYIDVHGIAQLSSKEKPLQWFSKMIGGSEKTSSEIKIARDNVELLKYNGELQHVQDRVNAGNINIFVENFAIVKGDLKVAKNGKTETNLTIETQKSEKKHTLNMNAKFHVQAPKYEIETELIVDDVKQVFFKTDSYMDEVKFSTKNVAEVLKKSFAFDAHADVKGDLRAIGNLQGNFVFTWPKGHTIDGNMKRKISPNGKSGNLQDNIEVQISQNFDGKKRTLIYTGSGDKFNFKTKQILQNVQVIFTNFDSKKLELAVSVKHLPKDQSKSVEIQTNLRGDFLNFPAYVNFLLDEYDNKDGNFRIEMKVDDTYNCNVSGRYNGGTKNIQPKLEIQGSAQFIGKIDTMQFSASGKLIKPTNMNSTYVVELHIDERDGGGQVFSWNSILKGTKHQSAFTLDWVTKDSYGPLKLEASYQNERKGIIDSVLLADKQHYSFNFKYNNTFLKTDADINYIDLNTPILHYTLDSCFDTTQKLYVDVHLQTVEPDTYEIKLHSKYDNKLYSSLSKIYKAKYKKGLDLHVTTAKDNPIVVTSIFEIIGEHKSKLLVEIENLMDLDFSCHAESLYKAVEDFYIKAKWNSAKLDLPNYDLDVHSQGKSIVFNMKKAQSVVLTGNATYSNKQETSKSIIDGQGQLQYNGKTQKVQFRAIYQIYNLSADKEIGFSYTFDGNFGPKKGVSTLKITNKDVNVKLSICEDKKQCTNIQVQSLATLSSGDAIETPQHSLLVVVDLRELGFPYEFELQSKTTRQFFKLQYSLESQIVANNNLKYKLVANIMPMFANIQLKLPKRELLLEVKQQYPPKDEIFGHYEHSIAFYFDKMNKPKEVTRVKAVADVIGTTFKVFNAKGEIKFEHPTIRPLTISGQLEGNNSQQFITAEIVLDTFRLPDQQIIGSLRIENINRGNGFNVSTSKSLLSHGIGFSYDFKGHTALNLDSQVFSAGAVLQSDISDFNAVANIYVSKDKSVLAINVLNEPILLAEAECKSQKYSLNIDSTLQLFRKAPIELITELQPTQSRFIAKQKDIFDLSADVKVGKELELSIQSSEKQLLNSRIALDAANFLQTTYSSNSEGINSFLNIVEAEFKRDIDSTVWAIKNKFKHILEIFGKQSQLLKKSSPDLSKLRTSYEININEIDIELENDPAFKQMRDSYFKIYTTIIQIYGDTSKIIGELYGSLHQSGSKLYEKIETVINDIVLPAWEDLLQVVSNDFKDLTVQITNLVSGVVYEVLRFFEQYAPALKSHGKAINEVVKPINEALQELFKVTGEAIEQLFGELRVYLTKLPTIDELWNEFNKGVKNLRLVENTLELINIIFEQLHALPLTQESIEFIDKLREYTESKLTNKLVNDEQVLQELRNHLLRAINSVWSIVNVNSRVDRDSITNKLFAPIFGVFSESLINFDSIKRVLSFRFSVFNSLLNTNWERIFIWNDITHWIFYQDFNLHGHIAGGHQVITFDGEHYSFSGNCKYILAQDSVDNNFTVIAQINNGKLKAIILTDRDGNYAEITDSGVLKMDGIQAEFPQHNNGIHTWRLFYTMWIYSEYGVEVMCTQEMQVCHIKVNNFYTSKTRGLLGNGNGEPYDDFIQVDGTIAADYATLGNGFGIGKCAPVSTQTSTSVPRSGICSELFSIESPLTSGYLFENAEPYRARCDAAVAEASEKEKELAACAIATAYGSSLKLKEIPTRLPSRCLKCTGGDVQRELGHEFTVKIPGNKADLIFVVDMDVNPIVLTKLVAPAILEVRESLKARGFNDIHIGVIAYNESQLYPAILTSDGGKLNYRGNLANVPLNGPKKFCIHCASQEVADPKMVDILRTVEFFIRSLAPQSDERAFRLALNFPFRAGAAKSIIGVRSNNAEFINLLKLLRAHFDDVTTNFNGALLHMIAPVNELSVDGISKDKLVGFNSRLVATLDGKDSKKRQKLQYGNDIGIEFVLNNGGWIFGTQNFDQLKPNEQKKTLNQVVNTLADTLFRTDIVSECKCEALYGLHPQHRCVIKSSNFLPNKKVRVK